MLFDVAAGAGVEASMIVVVAVVTIVVISASSSSDLVRRRQGVDGAGERRELLVDAVELDAEVDDLGAESGDVLARGQGVELRVELGDLREHLVALSDSLRIAGHDGLGLGLGRRLLGGGDLGLGLGLVAHELAPLILRREGRGRGGGGLTAGEGGGGDEGSDEQGHEHESPPMFQARKLGWTVRPFPGGPAGLRRPGINSIRGGDALRTSGQRKTARSACLS